MHKILTALLSTAGHCAAAPLTDDQILDTVRQRATALEEVTKTPQLMEDLTKFLCRSPTPQEKTERMTNPHLEKFSRLYVDKAGRPAAEGHETVHPAGTLLLKEKLPAVGEESGKPSPGKLPELFTGMLKREKGYNPACGDWEFFTVSGDAKKLTGRGKLTSCMECHQRYPDRDFTSQKLVPERVMKPGADGSILLHSRDAWVSGSSLRYEPQPHKNTLGYWTNKADTAKWLLEVPKGRYEVEITQGCGTGSGGAEVLLEFAYPFGTKPAGQIKFTVEDTGGFQNWKTRTMGTFETAEDSPFTLKVIPQSKPGAAVMDLQQIVLRPVRKSEVGQ